MPVQQCQWCHPNNGKASATMMATQGNDGEGAIAMTAMTSVQQQQKHECNNIDGTITTMMTKPEQWWQRCQHDKGNNTSAMRATTPAQLWQQPQCDKGNHTRAMRATTPVQLLQQCYCNNGNKNAIATTTKMRKRFQHNEDDSAGKDVWQLPLFLSSSLLLGCVCCLLQG
jgi:hypothetical protein